MGLDMYLQLRKYESLGSWDKNFLNKSKRFYPKELDTFADDIKQVNFMSKETEFQVGYWRKFNALHNYIVKTYADGEDDCKPVYIGDDLQPMIDLFKKILDDHSLASELLPTQSGFFFGSTEYDDYYFLDLEYTYKLFVKVNEFLKTHPKYDVIYRASW